MKEAAKQSGASTKAMGKLNNVLMQMRKNANHPGAAQIPVHALASVPAALAGVWCAAGEQVCSLLLACWHGVQPVTQQLPC